MQKSIRMKTDDQECEMSSAMATIIVVEQPLMMMSENLEEKNN